MSSSKPSISSSNDVFCWRAHNARRSAFLAAYASAYFVRNYPTLHENALSLDILELQFVIGALRSVRYGAESYEVPSTSYRQMVVTGKGVFV